MVRRYLHALITYRTLLRGLRKSPQLLQQERNAHLQNLVSIAYWTVPYYRRLFDQIGVRPEMIRGANDLAKLPITRREQIQALAPAEITSSRIDLTRCNHHRTSGSSGVPLDIYRTQELEDCKHLARLRVLNFNGTHWTDRSLIIGPRLFHHIPFLEWLGLRATLIISPFTPVEDQLRLLKSFRPTLLWAYPSCASLLARAVIDSSVRDVAVRRIVLAGEFLDKGTMEQITYAFGVPPICIYGSTEAGTIAWQCRPGGPYHVCDDLVIMEYLHNGQPVQPGDPGEVIITDLWNVTMPLIRYQQGDLATPISSPCDCGVTFSRMQLLSGRTTELLQLPSGQWIAPLELAEQAHLVKECRQFQMRHDGPTHFTVLVVLEPSANGTRLMTRITEQLGSRLPGFSLDVKSTNTIPREPSGKHKYFIRTLPTPA